MRPAAERMQKAPTKICGKKGELGSVVPKFWKSDGLTGKSHDVIQKSKRALTSLNL